MIKKLTPQLVLIAILLYANSLFADVRRESFYKTSRARQYISLGGNHKSDENSKEHELSIGYRYKNNKYIHEIELFYEAVWASTKTKPMRKTKELYEAELSSKVLILDSKNYFNFYHFSEYNQFSDPYYDVTNVAGFGRMLFDGKIEADLNIGYNHTRFANSQIVINPTLRVRFPITKKIRFSARGFIFKQEYDYDERIDSRLSFKFDNNISLDLIHKYRKDRYYYEKYDIDLVKVDRTYGIRIRYNF